MGDLCDVEMVTQVFCLNLPRQDSLLDLRECNVECRAEKAHLRPFRSGCGCLPQWLPGRRVLLTTAAMQSLSGLRPGMPRSACTNGLSASGFGEDKI